MDQIDQQILSEIQKSSDKKVYQIARKLNLPRSTVHNRIKKLEKDKIILSYKAIVDPKKLGKDVTAFIHIIISAKQSANEIAQKLKPLPNIEAVYLIAGQYDLIALARFSNTSELSDFIYDGQKGLRIWPGVERTESMIVLATAKENGVIEP
ncbi:MAG: Lrp/AsnC family transcriptional regulator [Candidatus Woesearchaeota archaeon]